MKTVKELRAYLETLPEDTDVKVACAYIGSYYQGTEWRDLDLEQYSGNVEYHEGRLGQGNTLYLGAT